MNKSILNTVLVFLFVNSAFAQFSASTSHFYPYPTSRTSCLRSSFSFGFDTSRSHEIQGNFIYRAPFGLEMGLGAHAGLIHETTHVETGFDLMLGYYLHLDEALFFGALSQIGFTYTGIGDFTVEPENASSFPITFAASFGGYLHDGSILYVASGIELGQTMRGGDVVFKTGLGVRLALGGAILLTEHSRLGFEIMPTLSEGHFSIKSNLGITWDF